MATKLDILSQADVIVTTKISERRPPMFETLKGAYEKLGTLTGVAKGFREQGDALTSEFQDGIIGVIRSLSAFRSGYASNDPTQAVAGPGTVTKRASLAEFVGYLKNEIAKAAAEDGPEALARLRSVSNVIKNGLSEIAKRPDGNKDVTEVKNADGSVKVEARKADDGGVTIPVFMDPMQVKTTMVMEPGDKTPSGTASPSTAASNFVVNPGEITTATPSAAPNPSTMAAVSQAGTGTGGQASAPFTGSADPMFLPGATSGPAASTSAVLAVTGGATNSGTDATNFSPDEVAKRAAAITKADTDAANDLVNLRKAADKSSRKRGGWSLDLNSPEFLKGERSIDFGVDGSK